MENSLSFESASISLPKVKRQRREIPKESLCNGIKSNGDQCSFNRLKNEMYCKRHIPKVIHMSIETNTCNEIMVDSSTNTEGTMLDVTTANKVILQLMEDKIEQEKHMTELIKHYKTLSDQLEQIQNI